MAEKDIMQEIEELRKQLQSLSAARGPAAPRSNRSRSRPSRLEARPGPGSGTS